jgi:hypothetical protein
VLLSVLLFVVGLLCTPLQEEVSSRAGIVLDRLLGCSGPSPLPDAGKVTSPVPPSPSQPRRGVARLPIEGIWVPSGWMGDAEVPHGPLRHRFTRDGSDGPICEEWSYQPAQGRRGWVAVGYQFPDSNWGARQGKDLSRFGFTRVTFLARARVGASVLFKAGGHTRPGAPFPASFEVSSGLLTLTRQWCRYTLQLPPGTDLSNTTTAFAFVLDSRWSGPVVFYLRDIAFEGPQE